MTIDAQRAIDYAEKLVDVEGSATYVSPDTYAVCDYYKEHIEIFRDQHARIRRLEFENKKLQLICDAAKLAVNAWQALPWTKDGVTDLRWLPDCAFKDFNYGEFEQLFDTLKSVRIE